MTESIKRLFLLALSITGISGCVYEPVNIQAQTFHNNEVQSVSSTPIGVVMGLSFKEKNNHKTEISGVINWQASDDLLVSEYAIYLASDLHTPADEPLGIVKGVEKESFNIPDNTQRNQYKFILLFTKNEMGLANQAAAVAI